jgi:hypothetical protein
MGSAIKYRLSLNSTQARDGKNLKDIFVASAHDHVGIYGYL